MGNLRQKVNCAVKYERVKKGDDEGVGDKEGEKEGKEKEREREEREEEKEDFFGFFRNGFQFLVFS